MKKLISLLLIISVAAFAAERTGGTGFENPWPSTRGTYTVDNIMAGSLSSTYGMAIKDNVANSIWLLSWGDMMDYEYDMVGGSATGESWAITGGVDPDDQAYCEYGTGNQWFMTDYASSSFGVYQEDGTFVRNIDGPAGYTNLFGIGAGHDHIYLGSPNESVLAWGAYTGTESSITWTGEMAYESVYGLAVVGDYLFVACGIEGADNMFIHDIAADGTPSATPVWSCTFIENATMSVNGGIDYDGTNLWVYPQNDFLYQLDIDWTMALDSETWAGIKASF